MVDADIAVGVFGLICILENKNTDYGTFIQISDT